MLTFLTHLIYQWELDTIRPWVESFQRFVAQARIWLIVIGGENS